VILGAAALFLLSGAVWIFGTEHWGRIDEKDPGKEFVLEIASSLKSFLPATSAHGSSPAQPSQPQSDQVKSEH
jgi:hypothetical protein